MIRINIIPHREDELILDSKIHIGLVAFIVFITLSIFYAVNSISSSYLNSLKNQMVLIDLENSVLKKKIGKIRDISKVRADVEHKISIVDSLQEGRSTTIRTLEDITGSLPGNVWITDIADVSGFVYIDGVSSDNKLIAEFMRRLEKSVSLKDVSLTITQSSIVNNMSLSTFSLKLKHEMTVSQKIIAKKLKNNSKNKKKVKHVKVK